MSMCCDSLLLLIQATTDSNSAIEYLGLLHNFVLLGYHTTTILVTFQFVCLLGTISYSGMKTKFANAFTVAASCNRFKTYGTLLDFNSATLTYSTVAENKT